MGSAIGDYVHLITDNYIKYGTNKAGESGSSAAASEGLATQVKSKIEKSMKAMQTLQPVEAQKIANRLTYLMRPPNGALNSQAYTDGESEAEYRLLWDATVEWLNEEYKNAVGKIEQGTANIYTGIQVKDYKPINAERNKVGIEVATAQKRIDALVNAINANADSHMYSGDEIQFLGGCLEQIRTAAQELEKYYGSFTSANHKIIPKEEAASLIQRINALAIVSAGAINEQKGSLFEGMIAAAQLTGQNLTKEAIKKAIKESVSGKSDRTAVTFDEKIFDSNVDVAAIFNKGYKVSEGIWQQCGATQNKVDVNFSFIPGGTRYRVSAKNVNLRGSKVRGVHLVSSLSLLMALMQVEINGNRDFVNHYLNQHVATYPHKPFPTFASYPMTQFAIKLALFEEALRGYKSNAAKADIFILNENTTGQITVMNMSAMLQKVIDNNMSSDYVDIVPNPATLTFANNFDASGYSARITKLLQQVHSTKITVSLTPAFFTATNFLL